MGELENFSKLKLERKVGWKIPRRSTFPLAVLQKNQIYLLEKLGDSFGMFPSFFKFSKNMPRPSKPVASMQAPFFAQILKNLTLGAWEIQFYISFMF